MIFQGAGVVSEIESSRGIVTRNIETVAEQGTAKIIYATYGKAMDQCSKAKQSNIFLSPDRQGSGDIAIVLASVCTSVDKSLCAQ